METFNIKSAYSDKVLATVLVNGDALEFQVDNSEGCLPSIVGKSLATLKNVISRSSHLFLEQGSPNGKYLLRYVTDSGDTIEISTDNSVCLYNGKLLEEKEKQQLFSAVRDGKVKIKIKADINKPVQVLPPMPRKIEYKVQETGPDFKNMYKALTKMDKKKQGTADFDPEFENMDWTSLAEGGDKDEADHLKRMAYAFKYGVKNGR